MSPQGQGLIKNSLYNMNGNNNSSTGINSKIVRESMSLNQSGTKENK